ncbi:8789_t:CDS:2, partial [Cetraspora pellucida]
VVDFCHLSGNNPQRENSMCNECSERLKNKRQGKKIVITSKKAKHKTAQINITSKNPNANTESSSTIAPSSSGNIPNDSIIIPDDSSIILQSNFSFIQNDFSIILPNDPNITQNDSSVILSGNSSVTKDNHSNMIIPSDSNNIILNNLRITIPKVPDNIVSTNIVSSNSSNVTSSYPIVSDIDNNIGLFSEKDFKFEEAETSDEQLEFTFEVELDQDLLAAVSLDQSNLSSDSDLKTIEKRFCQLANILIVLLESGSEYYWKIRKLYLNSRKKMFSGSATVYLGCTMRDDRAWQRQDGQPPKRRSEVCAPIGRYNCIGNIRLIVIPEQQYALIKGSHKVAHEKPTYRRVEFPVIAKNWIKNNVSFNMRSTEIYHRLCNNKLIDPEIHTVEQVYYWVSISNKKKYIMDQTNQLLLAKLYLEQPEFIEKGFKILNYLENDFVRTLGFLTPLIKHIRVKNITEIVIDSIFKTNQERFELFAVNANCDGYGMPIAYLYLSILDGTEEALHKGLKPVFVLMDKDAGEISSVNEAWSWITNIQLCYWHLEHAISKKIKDKKSKTNTYTATKALEAHHKFEFIDPSWFRSNNEFFCLDNYAKQLLEMIKRHANMHPLIPVAKNSYMTSQEIYKFCIKELYQFCRLYDFVKLWGYLWTNWYNESDWKLFARSSYSLAMPLAYTTMITESHWRVFKYTYKYNYNHPRVDKLTQIIVEQLIPDFEIKKAQYDGNRTFPAWWHDFKRDWKKAAAADTQPNIEENYQIDTNNWVCSCPAYLYSCYHLCKHLVHKKYGKNFLPTFLQTRRRHDYPLLTFKNSEMSAITLTNNPWTRLNTASIANNSSMSNSVEDGNSRLRSLSNTLVEENFDIMKERQEKYARYKEKFEAALELYKQEMNNDKFVDSFDALVMPFLKEIDLCETALQSRNQQATSKSKRKLTFWLR